MDSKELLAKRHELPERLQSFWDVRDVAQSVLNRTDSKRILQAPQSSYDRFVIDVLASPYIKVGRDTETDSDLYAQVKLARVLRGSQTTGQPPHVIYTLHKILQDQVHGIWVEFYAPEPSANDNPSQSGSVMKPFAYTGCGMPPIESCDYDILAMNREQHASLLIGDTEDMRSSLHTVLDGLDEYPDDIIPLPAHAGQ